MTDTEKRDHRRWVFLVAALCIMGLVFWLSSISDLTFFRGARFPSFFTWLMNTFHFRWGDGGFFSYGVGLHPDYLLHKAGHIILYGLLGPCLYLAMGRSLRLTLLVAVLFAFSDEWHQSTVSGRSARFFDVVLDVAAAWVTTRLVAKSIVR